ncbi:MAG: hypothetical protein WB507_06530 [Solirubrobacterales bacterium]
MGTGADSSGRSRQLARRAIPTAFVAVIATLALTACGSSEASKPSSSSSEPSALISTTELKKYPEGSVQQAFLNFWSDLQYRSWADAAASYEQAFRKFVGTAKIIAAKRINSSTYPLLKPEIQRIGRRLGETTVYYTVRLPEGTKELNSITWRRLGGNWQIAYDSRLDLELDQLEENRVEIEKNGKLPTNPQQVSPAATKAGNEGSELQARYRQQELKKEG